MKKEWCEEKSVLITEQSGFPEVFGGEPELKPRLYRCPKCKKRFHTYIRNCVGDLSFKQACCWSEYLPPHKKRIKNKALDT